VPDGLREDLEVFRHTLPRHAELERGYLFGYLTYLIVLFGKGYLDDAKFPAERLISRRDWKDYQQYVRQVKSQLLSTLPDHYDLLTAIRGRAAAPADEGATESAAGSNIL
jgi:hypothetical protein